ncbi:MAG: MazG nucleotide pyrophosphohydrolase domain-containing protein [Nitrososphaerota archaeon]|nr:nucleotide pyrophosphohydrolase [Candidatus Bathyarchaeota archaeon]MDW8022616.1 MazG nucleotide pyrophosphohydrolase domain-containing protein [Nitrososphaerota archaeon]
MNFKTFQNIMKEQYGEEDKKRGAYFLFVVLTAEVGELADALKKEKSKNIEEELADIIFCCTALANYFEIDLEKALLFKYVKQSKEQITKKWGESIEEWKGTQAHK